MLVNFIKIKNNGVLLSLEYANKLSKEYLQNNINYDYPIILLFENKIKYMATSFAEVFVKDIVDNIGIYGLENKVKFYSENMNNELKITNII